MTHAIHGAPASALRQALEALAQLSFWISWTADPDLAPEPVVSARCMRDVSDPGAVFARLDKAKEKYADIILAHGGGPGVERIAAKWAERNGVHQVVCKPDWTAHGRAAPFRRNDELLNLLPKGVIAFPGSGITENLVDKARQLGIPVQRCAA